MNLHNALQPKGPWKRRSKNLARWVFQGILERLLDSTKLRDACQSRDFRRAPKRKEKKRWTTEDTRIQRIIYLPRTSNLPAKAGSIPSHLVYPIATVDTSNPRNAQNAINWANEYDVSRLRLLRVQKQNKTTKYRCNYPCEIKPRTTNIPKHVNTGKKNKTGRLSSKLQRKRNPREMLK